MKLPPDFVRNIRSAFGKAGEQWLTDLPSLLAEAANKWHLTLGPALPLSYNYVTMAKRSDGLDVVLKIGVMNQEVESELTALRYFAGEACVHLLEADDEKCMFLLEQLKPGEMLASVKDDEKRTHIACDIMTELWRPAPDDASLIRLTDWFTAYSKLRTRFDGTSGPIPKALFERAEELISKLFAQAGPSFLIHGDLNHFNILSSGSRWLAIDPKGVIGPPEFECGPLLINPWPYLAYQHDAIKITRRRMDIFNERLGFPRELTRDWGFCHAILSVCWDLAEDGTGGEYSLACAEIIWRAGN